MTKENVIAKWENILANKEKRIKILQAKSYETDDIGTLRRLVEDKQDEQAGIIIINAILNDIKGME